MARSDSHSTNRNDTACDDRQFRNAAGLVISGPWIISVVSVLVLGIWIRNITAETEQRVILSSLIHIYAFTLILTAAPVFTMARFIDDSLSHQRLKRILPSYLGILSATCVLTALVSGAVFLSTAAASPFYRLAATALSILVAGTFISAGCLGALRRQGSVLTSCVCGIILSCGLSDLLLRHHPNEPAYALAGFVLGHLVLFLMLFAALYRELPPARGMISLSGLRDGLRFPGLALCGLFLGTGVWINQLMTSWMSTAPFQAGSAIPSTPDAIITVCFAILSIAPGLLVCHLKLDSCLTGPCSRYFRSLHTTGTRSSLATRRSELTGSLRNAFLVLIRVQGTTTAVLLVFAKEWTGLLDLAPAQIAVIRITLLGAFALILFLAVLTVLLTIDDRRGALSASAIFLATNTGITFVALRSGLDHAGIGFALASACGLAVATLRVRHLFASLGFRALTSSHHAVTRTRASTLAPD